MDFLLVIRGVGKLKNLELSRIFEQVARILKIKGENPYCQKD